MVAALVVVATPAAAQSTWQGLGADANWGTTGNFSAVPAATGSTLVFDGTNQLANVNNLVTSTSGITYSATAGAFVSTAVSPVTSLTIAGNVTNNSPATQTLSMPNIFSGASTVTVNATGGMVFGSATSNVNQTMGNSGATVTLTGGGGGVGRVDVLAGTSSTVQVGPTASSILDASALGTLNMQGGSLNVGASGSTSSALVTLRLAATNSLSFNTMQWGGQRTSATVTMPAPSTTSIRGQAGGVTKANLTLTNYNTSPGGHNNTSTIDFTGATVDAMFGTLILGQMAPNGALSASQTTTGNFTIDGAASLVSIDTLRLGYWPSGRTDGTIATQIAAGNLTIKNGTTTVGTAIVGNAAVSGTNTSARGVLSVGGGALTITTSFTLGGNSGTGTAGNQQGTLSITGGTVTSNVPMTTVNARSTLTLNGGTLDMGGNAVGSATQKIGSNGGALTFTQGTLRNVSQINGGDPLIKTGGATTVLNLTGANSWTGGTTVTGGIVDIGSAGALGTTGAITMNGGTLRYGSGGANTTDYSPRIVVNDGTTASFDTNGNAITFATALQTGPLGSGAVAKLGGGTLILAADNTYTGVTTVSSSTLRIGAGGTAGAVLGNIDLINTTSQVVFDRSDAVTYAGVIGGTSTGGIVKAGPGRLTLTGVAAYTGPASVTGGTLEIAAAGSLNSTSGITVSGAGAELRYNATSPLTKPLVLSEGTLSGTGTIATLVSVGPNARLSPGSSPGTQAFSSGVALAGLGSFLVEFNDATAVAAGTNPGWDLVDITAGSILDLSALDGGSSNSRYVLDLLTLADTTSPGTPGPMANYDAGTSYSFPIFRTEAGKVKLPGGGFAGGNEDVSSLFTINPAGWANTLPSGGFQVKVTSGGSGLELVTIVPEPAAVTIVGLGLALATLALARRRMGDR